MEGCAAASAPSTASRAGYPRCVAHRPPPPGIATPPPSSPFHTPPARHPRPRPIGARPRPLRARAGAGGARRRVLGRCGEGAGAGGVPSAAGRGGRLALERCARVGGGWERGAAGDASDCLRTGQAPRAHTLAHLPGVPSPPCAPLATLAASLTASPPSHAGSFPIQETEWYFGLRIRHTRRHGLCLNIPVNVTVGSYGTRCTAARPCLPAPPTRAALSPPPAGPAGTACFTACSMPAPALPTGRRDPGDAQEPGQREPVPHRERVQGGVPGRHPDLPAAPRVGQEVRRRWRAGGRAGWAALHTATTCQATVADHTPGAMCCTPLTTLQHSRPLPVCHPPTTGAGTAASPTPHRAARPPTPLCCRSTACPARRGWHRDTLQASTRPLGSHHPLRHVCRRPTACPAGAGTATSSSPASPCPTPGTSPRAATWSACRCGSAAGLGAAGTSRRGFVAGSSGCCAWRTAEPHHPHTPATHARTHSAHPAGRPGGAGRAARAARGGAHGAARGGPPARQGLRAGPAGGPGAGPGATWQGPHDGGGQVTLGVACLQCCACLLPSAACRPSLPADHAPPPRPAPPRPRRPC